MKSFKSNRLVTIMLLIIAQLSCIGQLQQSSEPETIELGKRYTYHSKILDEEREIWVRLPDGYDSEEEDFPVVYLLDGSNAFIYLSGLLKQFEMKSVPKSILVGIMNTDRQRDMTPSTDNEKNKAHFPTFGGADNFIKMLESELIPLVNGHFRTSEFKTLIGGSLGGLFVTYSLFTKPGLFNAYLSISPSLWWNDQKIVDYYEQKLKANPDMKAILYMTMGNEGGHMLGAMTKLAGVLETESPKNIRWAYKVHPEETHGSNSTPSMYEGLEFFYKDWIIANPQLEYLNKGLESIELRSARIKNEFNEEWDLTNRQYYTILSELNKSGMFAESRDLGLSLLEKNNTCFMFLKSIAESYLALGNQEKAIKYYSEAYKTGPGDQETIKMIDSLGIDKQSLVPVVKLRKRELERLAGTYVQDNFGSSPATLTLINDTITVHFPGFWGYRFKTIPMAKDKLYAVGDPLTIDFYFEGGTDKPASYFIIRFREGKDRTYKFTRRGFQ